MKRGCLGIATGKNNDFLAPSCHWLLTFSSDCNVEMASSHQASTNYWGAFTVGGTSPERDTSAMGNDGSNSVCY